MADERDQLQRDFIGTNMRVDIQPLNLFRSRQKMENRTKKMKDAIEGIFIKSLFVLEKYSKIESPVRTGRMRASITDGKQLFPTFAQIGPTVHYAKYVHKKNPFMARGARKSLPEIKKVVKQSVSEAIK